MSCVVTLAECARSRHRHFEHERVCCAATMERSAPKAPVPWPHAKEASVRAKILALLISTCSIACSNTAALSATAATSPDQAAPTQSADASNAHADTLRRDKTLGGLPGDACLLDGYRSFFEAFVEDAAVRSEYATPVGTNAARNFRIASIDNRWVLLDLHGKPERPVELRLDRAGQVFGASFEAPAASGQPAERATYRFVFEDGCWRLDGLQH
jgi:hypothetical protein